ncbi:hypothetical protein [Xanthomonas nasturtii]|uniref:hypothetical protein n=1 Tax=Xanthomonas nasturtii TaxID=1843581 RepID=UPI002B22F2AF|nr:hypothetical protein [Xanthomonas nasturtii]
MFNPPDRLPAPVRRFSLAARVAAQAMDAFFPPHRSNVTPAIFRRHSGFGFSRTKDAFILSMRAAFILSEETTLSPFSHREKVARRAGCGSGRHLVPHP